MKKSNLISECTLGKFEDSITFKIVDYGSPNYGGEGVQLELHFRNGSVINVNLLNITDHHGMKRLTVMFDQAAEWFESVNWEEYWEPSELVEELKKQKDLKLLAELKAKYEKV